MDSHRNRAFTILELIIVMVVIGILIGIAIPMVKGMQQNSNVVKANKELATLQAAVESYWTFNSSIPISTTPITNLQQQYLINASPKMISSIFYDPFALPATEYSYMTSSNGKYYLIWSISLPGKDQPTGIDNSGIISY